MDSILKGKQISPYLVFFVIHSMQIGIAILGFQREIANSAGYDSWVAVIFATAVAHIALFIMFKVVELGKGDLIEAHYYVFGKIVGKLFNIIFIVYFTALIIAVLRAYVEILQVWVFPTLSLFWFTFSFLLLALYIVNGGFRTIVGISFFSVVLPFYIYFIFLFAVPYSDYTDFLPILHHSLKDILTATLQLSIAYLGYETLLIFYPFIQDGKKAKKWAHYAILFTGFIYLFIIFISFGYYSEPQLQHIIWSTLSIWKIVKLPFLWRFEYIGISMWSLVILPNICIPLWCASRIMKKTMKVTQRKAMIWIAIFTLIISQFFQTRLEIEAFLSVINKTGFVINYIYIPFLLLILLAVRKVKKK